MNVLVTGSSGFVGTHLVEYLSSSDYKVWSIDIKYPKHVGNNNKFEKIDFNNEKKLEKFIKTVEPDIVFHIAGLYGTNDYRDLYKTNLFNTIILFDVLIKIKSNPIILVTSSSSIYGNTSPKDNPIDEIMPFMATNHYGSSKVCQEIACIQYYLQHKLRIIRARTFNLLGPGMPTSLFASSVAKQIVEIELKKKKEKLYVGNLTSKRDFIDVRDAVKAYLNIILYGKPGEAYNVCTGKSYYMSDCIKILTGYTKNKMEIIVDNEKVKKDEVKNQIGNNMKLKELCPWDPKISLENSLLVLINYWRKIL